MVCICLPQQPLCRAENIRLERRYGMNHIALLRCRACKKTFSENRGTPFFELRLPYEKLYRVLTSLARCGSIRGTAVVGNVVAEPRSNCD